MLSDSEARRLAQLEASLCEDDPKFVRRFDASCQERRRLAFSAPWLPFLQVFVVTLALVAGNSVLLVCALTLTLPLLRGRSRRFRGRRPRRDR